MNSKLVLGLVLLVGQYAPGVQAQLAITEVMSLASLEDTVHTNRRPDYWEIKNFGTNDINVDGYSYSDKRQKDNLKFAAFRGLTIAAGETVVFFRVQDDIEGRSSITNVPRFREWWGEGNLSSNLQIRIYKSPGLNGEYGDQLWVYDRQTNVVDYVTLGQARMGRSFTCENITGLFGALSTPGIDGAVVAALGGDVGSPGTTIGPFNLDIARQPADQTADAGGEATFSISATGLPRPKYEWFFNGEIIPGETSNSLTLFDLQPEHSGDYAVRVYNGLEVRMSDTAVLEVEINPRPPVVVQAPMELTVYPGQTAVFSARARGYPALSYQWQSNGVDIPGAASRTLLVSNVNDGFSGVLYTVQIWNDWGTTNLSALLLVAPKPMLRFTESMGNPIAGDSSAHYDWFELTNDGTNTVNLQGYRFFDSLTFEGAWTISTPLSIRPGESVVFVEEMTPALFWRWWGAENQMGVQVYTYHGFSLGNLEGNVYLWNAAALDPLDTTSVFSWASLSLGVSQECENWCDTNGCDGMCFLDSVVGQNGAYRAAVNGDIGSPGFTTNPPPRILAVNHYGTAVQLKCRVVPNKSYRLKTILTLGGTGWSDAGDYQATGFLLWIDYPLSGGDPTRFYLLEEVD